MASSICSSVLKWEKLNRTAPCSTVLSASCIKGAQSRAGGNVIFLRKIVADLSGILFSQIQRYNSSPVFLGKIPIDTDIRNFQRLLIKTPHKLLFPLSQMLHTLFLNIQKGGPQSCNPMSVPALSASVTDAAFQRS